MKKVRYSERKLIKERQADGEKQREKDRKTD